VLAFASGVGKCVAFARGAIALVIGAIGGLGASLGDVCMWAGLAVGVVVADGLHATGGVLSSPLPCEASASRITNAARKFAIVFRIPSGNGPDRVSFHSNSIRRSLASHCATVLSDAGVLAQVGMVLGVAAVGFAMTGVCVAVPRCSRIFFAAFRQMSSMVVRGLMTK
jgi:hypothetical protein